ncbi:hypothetical protein CPHO_02120 [Corynebacterium phocae]|uniref:Lipase n=1 Tax=Corynebacterium phocae TaxID=161895 RepID=A0A1L7D1R3_9CORY|nr:lipase family protein [Corynebacterium phocae]APT91901.1 hypothetical protein CPHO_02120 [Corynebacterium phocae]KAA8727402.1 alpha/beta fold hydrolase [Corynebacterium phocae]
MNRIVKTLGALAPTLALALAISPPANGQEAAAPRPGQVVSVQDMEHLVGIFGPIAPQAQVFEYRTTLENGAPTVATATLFEPSMPWLGQGPRPTVVIAPVTRGQGDQCAPSRADMHVLSVGLAPSGFYVNVDYEYQSYQNALNLGMRVVVPDYIGLGSPGIHSYGNAKEQAHAVIDAARAGLALGGLPADSPVGFSGYSQGGASVAAAAEEVAEYSPELNLKGTYAGAPPADLTAVLAAVDGSHIAHSMGYAINGFVERDPEISNLLFPLLNDKGHEFISSAATSCIADSERRWAYTRSETLTTTGESLAHIMGRIPRLAETIDRQKLGRRPVTGPMLIANSGTDNIIPFAQTKELGGAYCAQGGTIQLVEESVPEFLQSRKNAHSLPYTASAWRGLFYLLDRFNGLPAPSNCQ